MHANSLRKLAALVFCGLFLVVFAARADDWSRFHGPNGTGIAADQKLPVEWTKDNILWKTPIPGEGHSSPIVSHNRVFLQTALVDGTRKLLCLNAKTGKELWAASLPGIMVKKHKKNSFASSTPATDGKRVFTAFWDGEDILLYAYDFDGKKAWSRNLGSFKSQHGAGASPIVYKDKVIYCHHQDMKSTLFALDAKTGAVVWKSPRTAFRACYGSPFLWRRNGKTEMVLVSTLHFTGYNPDNGDLTWQWNWKHWAKRPLRVTGSPAFAGDVILGCSGDGSGDRYAVAVRVNEGRNPDPELVWSNKKDFPYVPTPLSYKGHVYFTNDYGVAGCYDAKTGKRLWFERISDVPITSSPVMADGKIYAANEEGDVFVIAAQPKFNVLARNSLGERVRATPAIANNRLYVRGQRHLFCIGER